MSINNNDEAGVSPTRTEPNHLRRAGIIWFVLSVIGIALAIPLLPLILPVGASALESSDNFSILLLTALAVPVAMFVFVGLGYSMIVFRVKERPVEDAVPLKPRPGLQIGWMGITGALCLFLVIYGLLAFYQEAVASPSDPVVVQVTGQQWLWTFHYPQYGASSKGQVLELPVNRPVEFQVTSKDVLHGFAIRALGVRVDANPGQITTTPIVTPNRIGSYTVVCVELCGLYHSYMWSAVNVVSASSFNSWIVSQGGHT
ncbi:MAG: cytochrome c oxidase subunit II [Ktedonobacteraceae bacterium]|nr:cytochrome c oxidase subunit II [Ktedonobacteraceae bacterium]